MTGLRHELFRVNQTYNSLNGPKSCRRPVVSLSYSTKSYRVNRPLDSFPLIMLDGMRAIKAFDSRMIFAEFERRHLCT